MARRQLRVASEACCGGARHRARRRGGRQQDEEEGGGAKDGWRSLAGSEPTAGAGRALVRVAGRGCPQLRWWRIRGARLRLVNLCLGAW